LGGTKSNDPAQMPIMLTAKVKKLGAAFSNQGIALSGQDRIPRFRGS
jgi:hypothetical protein